MLPFSSNLNDSNYEIRCPKCYFLISLDISQNQNKYNIITSCENCGRKEISLEEFDSTMRKNNIKICNNCCKNFEIKTMLVSKINHDSFLCYACFQKDNKNNSDDNYTINYIPIKDIDKFCRIHKNEKNSFFCLNCNKHICQKCKKEHETHKIKSLLEESKSKYDLEKMKHIYIEEKENFIKEKKLYNELISNMRKRFLKIKKNNDDILSFKKLLFDIYESNSHNYGIFKYINLIINDKNYGLPGEEISKINDLVDNLSLNNNLENSKDLNSIDINKIINMISNILNSLNNTINIRNNINRFDGRMYSKSTIKESKSKVINPNLGDEKSKQNSNKNSANKEKAPKNYGSQSTFKVSRYKGKNPVNFSDLIKRQIQSKENLNEKAKLSSETKNNGIANNSIHNGKNGSDQNFQVLKQLKNSIIIMLYLGENKILISIFSSKNDLILGEIIKGKNINKNELISLEILPVVKNFEKPLNYMELCEDGSILSFSQDQIVQFKLINKGINIILSEKYEDEYKPIKSCISLTKDKLLVLTNDNVIHFYENGKVSENTQIVEGCILFSMNKISSNHIILVGQKKSISNKIWLFVMKFNQNEIVSIHDKDLNVSQSNYQKIIIQKMYDNFVAVTYPGKGFFIYDYLKNHVVNNVACDNIVQMKIEIINDSKAFCYIVESKDNEGKNIEDIKLKKYLIEKNCMKKRIEIYSKESEIINLTLRKKINDMIIINENNGGMENDKKLIFLGDNEGNILYNYC